PYARLAAHRHSHSVPTRRSSDLTQHWIIQLFQKNEVMLTCTAVFANRRKTWSILEAPFPSVPAAKEIPSMPTMGLPAWVGSYDIDRKSTRLNSSHVSISYAVFCL